MDSQRLVRHFLAAIAYRAQKAMRDAPAAYWRYDSGNRSRTPAALLRHMTSVLGYTRTFAVGGSYPFEPEPLESAAAEQQRFHEMLSAVSDLIAPDGSLGSLTAEQLLQGPLADVMTHVGQLAMLRRLAGAPVAPENFIFAEVDPANLSPDQPAPARPDAEWRERL
ncbi:MAG: hypothetical protein IT357_16230 [Gemmatimonadaceae bacterium]|nr:hypothetical protein [Gemmatimonadaceae bacterium]